MNKEKIVRTIGFQLFIFPAFLAWLSNNFTPLFFSLENTTLYIPKNLFLFLLITTIIICLSILRYFWKNQYFDCQNSFFPPTIIECLPPLLLAFFLNGILDNSQPYTIATRVIDKKVIQSKTFHYKLTLKQPNETYLYLDVSPEIFYDVMLNDKLIITAKHGYFNVPWRQNFYLEK